MKTDRARHSRSPSDGFVRQAEVLVELRAFEYGDNLGLAGICLSHDTSAPQCRSKVFFAQLVEISGSVKLSIQCCTGA